MRLVQENPNDFTVLNNSGDTIGGVHYSITRGAWVVTSTIKHLGIVEHPNQALGFFKY